MYIRSKKIFAGCPSPRYYPVILLTFPQSHFLRFFLPNSRYFTVRPPKCRTYYLPLHRVAQYPLPSGHPAKNFLTLTYFFFSSSWSLRSSFSRAKPHFLFYSVLVSVSVLLSVACSSVVSSFCRFWARLSFFLLPDGSRCVKYCTSKEDNAGTRSVPSFGR